MYKRNAKRLSFLVLILLALVILLANYDHCKQNSSNQHVILLNHTKILNSQSISTTSNRIITTTSEYQNEVTSIQENVGKFFVHSKYCKMPYSNPFSAEAKLIYSPAKFKSCSNDSALVSVIFNEKLAKYMLHINYEILSQLPNVSANGDVKCSYKSIERINDFEVNITSEVYFVQDSLVPRHIEGIIVTCRNAIDYSIIQTDAFAFVQPQNQTSSIHSTSNRKVPRKPSIIMIGIDSMSRINFRRTMPLTGKYLSRSGWYEMQGYNKAADDTLHNLLAVLVGTTNNDGNNKIKCYPNASRNDCFDSLPFIWNNFKSAGYMTAFAEDVSNIHSFHWEIQPVDYYLRPFLLGMEKTLKLFYRFSFRYCVGRRLNLSYVFDYCMQFIERYIFDRPIFGLFWTSSFTHDYYYGAASLDKLFVNYLQKYESLGLFENAIVIVFSDHGSRFGELLELDNAYLEERLPMLFIWLPKWFRQQYPKYAHALELNRNRLTSNYDLYFTLQHILALGRPKITMKYMSECKGCHTLFQPVLLDRKCDDAGINKHWCACYTYINTSSANMIDLYYYTKLIVVLTNQYLRIINLDKKCETLMLHDLINAQRKLAIEEDNESDGTIVTYRIKYKTDPGQGIFETTLVVNNKKKILKSFNIHQISRLNSYNNDSYCTDNVVAKKFCVCKVRK